MIIETSANHLYFVADYEDTNLAHVWRGLRGKFIKGGHFILTGKREEMVRKAGSRVIDVSKLEA